jgi:hypothetical protein
MIGDEDEDEVMEEYASPRDVDNHLQHCLYSLESEGTEMRVVTGLSWK